MCSEKEYAARTYNHVRKLVEHTKKIENLIDALDTLKNARNEHAKALVDAIDECSKSENFTFVYDGYVVNCKDGEVVVMGAQTVPNAKKVDVKG